MNSDKLNEAIVEAISESAVPKVDKSKLVMKYGTEDGEVMGEEIVRLVREAIAMPIEWGQMTLAEGVQDILGRFGLLHPGLSPEALHEIGRCVGWSWR